MNVGQDPLADMLTRIRNALRAGKESCVAPYSKLKESVLKVLKDEGYIEDFAKKEDGKFPELEISLKYVGQTPAITGIKRVSKPSVRRYTKIAKAEKVLDGLGASIISTSKGVLSLDKARELNVGGEVLAHVW